MGDVGTVSLKPPPSRARVWWLATRPATLAAAMISEGSR